MAIYTISDLHGCKEEFDQLLKLISFSNYDELYVIGDVCDRGKDPIGIYLEMMKHDNMHLIRGNHDQWFLQYIDLLIEEKLHPGTVHMSDDMIRWTHLNGGLTTMDQFLELDLPTCHEMKIYLEKSPFYQELSIRGNKFLLVHAGLKQHCIPGVHIASVPIDELIWSHIGLDDNPFQDQMMIVGHIPTFIYGKEYDGHIIRRDLSKIYHIDCGCCSGRNLGCLRLNDLQEFYVPSTYPYIAFAN
ncbi:MAG: fructose-bisphosphatase class III [Solobacterium sp.]|nr:fructose-bisphosphatase class III [Solobacterium sp.]